MAGGKKIALDYMGGLVGAQVPANGKPAINLQQAFRPYLLCLCLCVNTLCLLMSVYEHLLSWCQLTALCGIMWFK